MVLRSTSIALLFLATAGVAQASGLCDRLYARLADLPRPAMSTTRVDDTGAITRQNIELRRARIELRRLGCSSGSIVVIGGPNEAACADLEQAIDGMRRDLEDLRQQRLHQLASGSDDAMRHRILVSLQMNQCEQKSRPFATDDENANDEASVEASDGASDDAVIEASAGPREHHRNILKDLPPIGESDDGMTMRGGVDFEDITTPPRESEGRLRTMCVRTCDGAFFPISSNATSADFARDSQSCQQRCPGSETQLYYHKLETEEADSMVSAVTGEPYAALPTAFAYKTRDPGTPGLCGCALPKSAATRPSAPISPSVVDLSKTGTKPDIATVKPAKTPEQVLEQAPAKPYDPTSPVRVVGPTFLPPQESAIDLKHPKGPGYQQLKTN